MKQTAIGIAKYANTAEAGFHWGPWRYLLIGSSLFIALLSLYFVTGYPSDTEGWPAIISFVSLTWLIIYFMCSYAHFKTAYLFTSAYILMLCLFHLGIVIPHSFGVFGNYAWGKFGTMSRWYERAGWYTSFSLACLGLGFGLSIRKHRFQISRYITPVPIAEKTLSLAFWDGVGLFLASNIFLILAVLSYGNLLNYSRADFFHGVGDSRGLGVFMMCFPSSAILLVIGARQHWEKLFATFIALSAFLILLFSGYRSAAFFPVLVGIVLWVKVGRRVPIIVALSAVIFVTISIPVIGMLRGMGPYKAIEKQDIEHSVAKTSAKDTFKELGQTIGVLAHVIRLVPEKDPYRYGMTYLRAFSDSVPNIMPQMSESYRKLSQERAFKDPSAIGKMAVPSDWITYRLSPDKYRKGEGLGFTAIGEPYLNFGIIGVTVFFVSLGFLLGCLDSTNLLESPKLLIFSCSMLWPLIRTARNDFSNFIKPAIFILIILFIWRSFNRILPFRKI